ncbi:hypothetical protein BYT27DRAFT_7251350 [Phlegmacium glaucopus]|nr:hypothetical protein BYT27DRAFT_7251350 [Phlegmacium glaucopus]
MSNERGPLSLPSTFIYVTSTQHKHSPAPYYPRYDLDFASVVSLDLDFTPVIGLASTIRSFLDNPGAELLQVLERCNHSALKVYECKNIIKWNQAYVFQNDTYNDGFVKKNFKTSTLIINDNEVNPINVHPCHLSTQRKHSPAPYYPRYDLDFASVVSLDLDFASVVSLDLDFASARHWPRLCIGQMLDVDSVSPVIGLASTIRSFLDNPSAELLQVLEQCDHSDLKVYKCKNVIKRNQAYVFQNDTYNDGFVEKNFKSTLIIDNNDVNPTLDEIMQFTQRQDRCDTHIVNLSVIKRREN